MLSKRKEHFRYNFMIPHQAVFSIIKTGRSLNDQPVKTSLGQAEILNISPGGLKIQTIYDIPLDDDILLEIKFTINDHIFLITGQIRWQQKIDDEYVYGIKLVVSPEEKRELIDELKKYSRRIHRISSTTIG